MKKIASITLAITLIGVGVIGLCNEGTAADGGLSDLKIIVDGKNLSLLETSVLIDDRTYITLRTMAEAMNAQVEYDDETNSVFITTSKNISYPGDDWTHNLKYINGKWIDPWYIGDDGIAYECFRDADGEIVLKTNYVAEEYYYSENITNEEREWFEALSEHTYLVSDFSEGVAIIKKEKDGKIICGYVDIYGNEVFFDDYTRMGEFSEGIAKASTMPMNKSWPTYGFINKAGEMIIPEKYQWTSFFSEGVCAVAEKKGDNCYFINTKGEKMFDGKEYTAADWFSEGYCVVKTKGTKSPGINDKYSYIDHTGELVTEKEWDYAGAFKNGYAKVKDNGQMMRIDKNFKVVEYLDEDGNPIAK